MLYKLLIAASLFLAAPFVLGQATIVDSKPMGEGGYRLSSPPPSPSRDASSQIQSEIFVQVQQLQEEVLQLRGLVEQQSYELKQLKQQRLDDYLDLDRRISQKDKAPTADTHPRMISTTSSVQPDANAGVKEGEFSSYQTAIGFALKKRDFEGATAALNEHLKKYPQGNYVANAQFWLGQIYLQKGEYELSKKWLVTMIEQFPNHRKAEEARFKLAKVYHKLGDVSKAKALLQDVSEAGSSVAGLAQDYLKQNF